MSTTLNHCKQCVHMSWHKCTTQQRNLSTRISIYTHAGLHTGTGHQNGPQMPHNWAKRQEFVLTLQNVDKRKDIVAISNIIYRNTLSSNLGERPTRQTSHVETQHLQNRAHSLPPSQVMASSVKGCWHQVDKHRLNFIRRSLLPEQNQAVETSSCYIPVPIWP